MPMFRGTGATAMGNLWSGRLVAVDRIGEHLRVKLASATAPANATPVSFEVI